MNKNKHLYTKIGPILAIGSFDGDDLLKIDVLNSDLKISKLRQSYSSLTEDEWIIFDTSSGSFILNKGDEKILLSYTALTQKIWGQMKTISCGSTQGYKEVGILLGNDQWSRAVGRACATNPLPLIVPCHRVCGKTNPWLYGPGEQIKKDLLLFEQEFFG